MFKGNSLFNLIKGETSSGSSQAQTNSIVERLVGLFPDADPEYLRYCVGFYQDNHIERISEKICNHNKGHYPKIPEGCCSANSIEAKNAFLLQLNELFPDCEVSFIRENICNQEHSHVQGVTETLLNMERGSKSYPRRLNPSVIEAWERIRSPAYMKAVRYKLYNDFPNIWKSTIKAVLAENNFDYIRSFAKLKDLTTNNWWAPIFFGLFSKSYKELNNSELTEDIRRIRANQLEEQSQADREIAKQVNFTEYTDNDQLITCGCCYGDYTFEDLTCCNEGHLFCKECIIRLVQEGLYGQGSLRGKRINCIESSGCEGYFTEDQLKETLSPDVFNNYIESIVEHSLKQANLPLVQCPFCSYCEVEDEDPLRISKTFIIVASIPLAVIPLFASLENIISAVNMVAIFILPQIVLGMMGVLPIKSWLEEIDNIVRKVKRRRRGNMFKCQNPGCSKVSCMMCNRECRPFHKCYEKEQDSLRLFVEKAMVEAVKRTCPKCHVSFTKSDGCNKMTCRCGYLMCYLCRKDLRQESYAHFCDHFRPIPGQKCKKCNKCDLYKTEDEEIVIKEAAAKARAEFIKAHPEAKEVNLLENTAIGPITSDDERIVRESFERAIEKIIEYLLP